MYLAYSNHFMYINSFYCYHSLIGRSVVFIILFWRVKKLYNKERIIQDYPASVYWGQDLKASSLALSAFNHK